MSTDRRALHRAVCADHEDDTLRLAFADYLDEHDAHDRAEFVRLQVEFARLLTDDSDSQAVYRFLADRDELTRAAARWDLIDPGIARRVELASRLEALWNEHGTRWTAELPDDCGVRWIGFYRGFPGAAEVTDFDLLTESADRVKAASPPVELVCHGITGGEAQRLIGAGLLPWVRGLTVRGNCAEAALVLGRHPAAAGVRTLRVHDFDESEGALLALALAGSAHWSGLWFFDAGGAAFGPHAADTLFRAAHLRDLRFLRLEGAGWTTDTVRAFADARFPNLIDLRLTTADLDDDAAEVLADVPSLGSLRTLDLGRNRIGGRGASALLASPHLANLAFLSLEFNRVRGLDRKRLKSAAPGGLRLFHAHGCRVSVNDAAALARCPRLRGLWYFDLDDNGLGPGAARELVRGFKDRCPPVVWLTWNRLDDASAAELANWPAAERLRVLEVSRNPLTAAGARALLASPHLKNLDRLGVPSGLGEAVDGAVRDRFGNRGRVE